MVAEGLCHPYKPLTPPLRLILSICRYVFVSVFVFTTSELMKCAVERDCPILQLRRYREFSCRLKLHTVQYLKLDFFFCVLKKKKW